MARLFIFSGFPGSGKSTLSKMLSKYSEAVYVRIDSIEQAIRDSQFNDNTVMDEGYLVGYAIARDNLTNGYDVVTDSVNSIKETRDGWNIIGKETNSEIVNIEIECSDKEEHRNRIETRESDIKNHVYPDWNETINREYEIPNHPYVRVDTAGKTIDQSFTELLEKIKTP